jgi:hypothetical protein
MCQDSIPKNVEPLSAAVADEIGDPLEIIVNLVCLAHSPGTSPADRKRSLRIAHNKMAEVAAILSRQPKVIRDRSEAA